MTASERVTSSWSRLPLIARSLLVALGSYALLVVLAGSVSRYRDFQLSEIGAYLVAIAGLTVLTGLNGQISLGHGALMAVGAYTAALLLLHTHLPLLVILLLAIVAGAVFGVAVGVAAARLRGPYLAGATLALAVALPQIPKAYRYFGRDQGLTINPPSPPGWLGVNFPLERWGADLTLLGAVDHPPGALEPDAEPLRAQLSGRARRRDRRRPRRDTGGPHPGDRLRDLGGVRRPRRRPARPGHPHGRPGRVSARSCPSSSSSPSSSAAWAA